MKRVHLDDYEDVILVKLRPGHKDSALGVMIKTLETPNGAMWCFTSAGWRTTLGSSRRH